MVRNCHTPIRRCAWLMMVILMLMLAAACGTTGPVGLTPSQTPTARPTPRTTYQAFKLDVFVDAESVTPVNRTFRLEVGSNVILTLRSDHDVSVQITGPELDNSVFVARLSTITTSFVVDHPGKVTISTDDPQATIATLIIE